MRNIGHNLCLLKLAFGHLCESVDRGFWVFWPVIPGGFFSVHEKLGHDLAEGRAKIKIINRLPPLDPGRNRPNKHHLLRKMAVRKLPRDPPGEAGAKTNIKNRSKHSQGDCDEVAI